MYKISYFLVLSTICHAGNIQRQLFHHTQVRSDNTRDPACSKRNSYQPAEGSCDAYVECRDYQAHDMLCPNGLHYNPAVVWPEYPCGYPMDVPCRGLIATNPAEQNVDCPYEYGFFPSPKDGTADCGRYRQCVKGHPVEMHCAAGLAFNPELSRCDWPDLVSTCDTQQFLGFVCPQPPTDKHGHPLDVVLNYRHEDSLRSFFSCEGGRARLLTCDSGLAFDESTGRCEDEELVVSYTRMD